MGLAHKEALYQVLSTFTFTFYLYLRWFYRGFYGEQNDNDDFFKPMVDQTWSNPGILGPRKYHLAKSIASLIHWLSLH